MVSTDNIRDNTGFAKKNKASFPILADPKKRVSKAYGVLAKQGYAKRWTFYINPEGIIEKIDKNTNPVSAGADLTKSLLDLEAPLAGG